MYGCLRTCAAVCVILAGSYSYESSFHLQDLSKGKDTQIHAHAHTDTHARTEIELEICSFKGLSF